jgi:hypothetical protein
MDELSSFQFSRHFAKTTAKDQAGKDLKTLKIKPIAMRISRDNAGGYMIWGSKTCKGEKSKIEQDKRNFLTSRNTFARPTLMTIGST